MCLLILLISNLFICIALEAKPLNVFSFQLGTFVSGKRTFHYRACNIWSNLPFNVLNELLSIYEFVRYELLSIYDSELVFIQQMYF